MTRPVRVLLLSKAIPSSLQKFFAEKKIVTVTVDQHDPVKLLSHILIGAGEDLEILAATYQTVAKDIRLLSLAPVEDMTQFLASNGRMVVDEQWFATPMGKVTLEKFFLGRASVHLEENFPAIKEHGGFKVTNHLHMGHDMDRMATFIHARNSSLVNVRTFVDHAIYYACYLTQASIGSAPYEVDYGFTGADMVVQVHLPVRRFVAETLMASFNQANSDDPVSYLLQVCMRSTDFAEIQYIEVANKLVISGFWKSQAEAGSGFKGILLNHIRTSEQILHADKFSDLSIEEGAIQFVDSTPAEDLLIKPLIGGVPNPEQPKETITATGSESPVAEGELVTVVKGRPQDKESVQVVKGGDEKPGDFKQTIAGSPEAKDNFTQKFSAEALVKDKEKITFAAGAETKQEGWAVKSLGQAAAEKSAMRVGSIGVGANGDMKVTKTSAPAAAIGQMRELEGELKKVKQQIDMATKELSVLREFRKKMLEVDQQASETPEADFASEDGLEAIDAVNKAENEVRKAKLEVQQKQAFFAQELDKNLRQLKAKDSVIEKAKDSIRVITMKKDREIAEMKTQMEKITAEQVANATSLQRMKTIEQDRQALAKLVDVYKNKLSTMSANAEKQATNPSVKEEELRKLTMEKQTAQVALAASQRDLSKSKSRQELDQAEIKRLNEVRIELEKQVKEANSASAAAASQTPDSQIEEILTSQLKDVEKDLAATKIKASRSDEKVKELERKLTDMTASMTKAASGADSGLKAKISHLDAAVKRMTQELNSSANQLAEAKKESNKLRLDKTALQNEIERLKKASDKASGKVPAPKKAG